MENFYSALLGVSNPAIADSRSKYSFLTERHLHALWFEQKYLLPLFTSEGQPVSVVSPGLWNGEAGPDFKKAHFWIGSQEIKGDVEIHLSEEDWVNHRHHLDPRYNEVVVHLALWKPKTARTIATVQGKKIFQIYLEPFLTQPVHKLIKLFDLDLYPYKVHVGSGQCSHLLFKELDSEKIRLFFQKAAEWRLTNKLAHLQTYAESPNEIMRLGTAAALGYKNNSKEFLQIYLSLKEKKDWPEKKLFALALSKCGFFEAPYIEKWELVDYYQQLKLLVNNDSERITLALHHNRPLNHPVRRLSYLTKMVLDPSWDSLYSKMTVLWDESWQNIRQPRDSRSLRTLWNELLPSYPDPYWNHQYTFASKPSTEKLPLLGENTKQDIIINTFFPLLYSKIQIKAQPKELETFRNLYYSFPASGSGKNKYLTHRYFGNIENKKKKILTSAFSEQGAYQLHHDFCLHFEASCEGCPFVNRYKTIFQ